MQKNKVTTCTDMPVHKPNATNDLYSSNDQICSSRMGKVTSKSANDSILCFGRSIWRSIQWHSLNEKSLYVKETLGENTQIIYNSVWISIKSGSFIISLSRWNEKSYWYVFHKCTKFQTYGFMLTQHDPQTNINFQNCIYIYVFREM
jgi:hypothetical protein